MSGRSSKSPGSSRDRSSSPRGKEKATKTSSGSPRNSSSSPKGKQKMTSSNTKGKQKKPKLPELKLLRQGRDNLCSYYAYYHFTKGSIKKKSFLDTASKVYQQIPGVTQKEAQKMVEDGNDPSVFTSFGLEQKTSLKDAIKAGRLIVARMIPGQGHFYTLLKFNGIWWTYDSLKKEPIQIGDDEAVLKFLENLKKEGKFHFWA